MKNKIKEYRERYNITQQGLAESVGVSRQTISSLESGRYNPSAILAYKVAKVFKTTIESVFLFEEELQNV